MMTPAPVDMPEKTDKGIDNAIRGADCGECLFSNKITDDDAVYRIVKLLKQVAGHQRKSK